MRTNSKNTVLGVLACGGLGLALTACNGSSNGPNGTTPAASTTAPTTTRTGTTPVTTGATTGPVVTSTVPVATGPSSKFLYATNYSSNDVSVYSTAPSVGTLTSSVAAPLLTQPAAGPNAAPVFAAADATGSFLFVADSGTSALDCFAINRTSGALTPAPAVMTGIAPYAVLVDPSSKFVYTANVGDDTISAFTVGAGGALTPCTTPSLVIGAGAAPNALAMDPTGKFLYVANAGTSSVQVCSIDATGNPALVGTPVLTGQQPFSIASVNTGTGYVYVANNTDSTVSVLAIGAAGALTAPATGATVVVPHAGMGASVVVADPSGSFLYVLNGYGSIAAATNDIACFTISAATGALTPIGTSNMPAGVGPSGIAVNASGKQLYVSDAAANAILTFGIDPATGALVAEGTTPAGHIPTFVVTSN